MNQADLELEMYDGGRARAAKMMATNEEQGRAHANPYAQAVYRRFVMPLAEVIQEECNSKAAGRRRAHAALLAPLDHDSIAFLAVRTVMTAILAHNRAEPVTTRSLGTAIGRTIHGELVLAQIKGLAPDLYFTLANDLAKRLSKDEKHRLTVFRMQAKANDIPLTEWPLGAREQVGLWLLDKLEALGMIDIAAPHAPQGGAKYKTIQDVDLTHELTDLIGGIKDYITESMPMFLPCVEPPRDWVAFNDGGFHTEQMRRLNPWMVKVQPEARDLYNEPMPAVMAAINALQRTAWAINQRVLDTVYDVSRRYDIDEILSAADVPKPSKPDWLHDEWDKSTAQTWELDQFARWKRDIAQWHTDRKLRATKYFRFYTATRTAEKFRACPAIYFVYYADFRGRLYPHTAGVSPQGSDLQKALLRFAEGLPLADEKAKRWFAIHGANKWGYDKATLDDRVKWVREHHQLILDFADDPLGHPGWQEADCPLQFLAWCFEYADFARNPTTFKSHLPVSLDGSCNGLQNFSAMLRDEIGGAATNITANAQMRDIYRMVAEAATHRLTLMPEDADNFKVRWLAHGISRDIVKRPVMTTPYGVTKRTAIMNIVQDYLRHGRAPEFQRTEYQKAAAFLMEAVWPAIGDVVVKSREAMAWLQQAPKRMLIGGRRVIHWTTPSGFIAAQVYPEQEVHRINTYLHGTTKIRVNTALDTADVSRHAQGLAPNFVHSMDAAHLHRTILACTSNGIHSLAFIHDDYGTHAAHTEALYTLLRQEFYSMYTDHDPLQELCDQYGGLPPPPSKGTLDLSEVLQSEFFFS